MAVVRNYLGHRREIEDRVCCNLWRAAVVGKSANSAQSDQRAAGNHSHGSAREGATGDGLIENREGRGEDSLLRLERG